MKHLCIGICLVLLIVCGFSATGLAQCRQSAGTRVAHVLHKLETTLGAQDFPAAAQILERFLSSNPAPGDYRIFVHKAAIHAHNEELDQAAAAYAQALKLCDEQAWLWQNYAVMCWKLQRYTSAAEAFLHAYELSADPAICFDGIVALSYAGQPDVAAQKLRDLINTQTQVPEVWVETFAQLSVQAETVAAALTALQSWEPRFEAQSVYWRVRALLHLNVGAYHDAVAALRVADRLQPLEDEDRAILAGLLLQLDLPEQAATAYRLLLEHDPAHSTWQRQYIISLRLAEKSREALVALEQARAGISAEFYLRHKGELLYHAEDYSAAFAAFAELLRLCPDDAQIHLLQGVCASKRAKYALARRHLRKALESATYAPQARSMLQWLEQSGK